MKTSQWLRVKNGRGETMGFIEVFWNERVQRWMSVPGVSRWREVK